MKKQELLKIMKELEKYGDKYGVIVRTNKLEHENGEEYECLELLLSDEVVEAQSSYTHDDCVWYNITDQGIFFGGNYQRDDLEDLPHWVQDKKQLKELIKYFGI